MENTTIYTQKDVDLLLDSSNMVLAAKEVMISSQQSTINMQATYINFLEAALKQYNILLDTKDSKTMVTRQG